MYPWDDMLFFLVLILMCFSQYTTSEPRHHFAKIHITTVWQKKTFIRDISNCFLGNRYGFFKGRKTTCWVQVNKSRMNLSVNWCKDFNLYSFVRPVPLDIKSVIVIRFYSFSFTFYCYSRGIISFFKHLHEHEYSFLLF